MIDQLGGRKATFGIFLVAVAAALDVLAPHGLTQTMSTFLMAIGGGFFAGNSLEHAADATKVWADSKAAVASSENASAPAADVSGVAQEVKDLQVGLKAVVNQNAIIGQAVDNIAQGTTFLVQAVQASQIQTRG
jgi:hypothetical protein